MSISSDFCFYNLAFSILSAPLSIRCTSDSHRQCTL